LEFKKLSLQLYKTYNEEIPLEEWTHLNTNQYFTSRPTTFMKNTTGSNAPSNIFYNLNGIIELNLLDLH
jgi:hypothetical protein